MKTAGWILSIVLAIVVLILWKCPDTNVKSRADELEQQIRSLEDSFRVTDDSTKREVAIRDSIIAHLMADKEILSGELKVADVRITDLANRVRHAKVIRDTVEYYASCDSLAIAAPLQSALIKQYQLKTDSIISAHKKQLSAKDSMITARDNLYAGIRKVSDEALENIRGLATELDKEQKKRFSVGLQGGVGIGREGRPTWYVGAGLNYALKKF